MIPTVLTTKTSRHPAANPSFTPASPPTSSVTTTSVSPEDGAAITTTTAVTAPTRRDAYRETAPSRNSDVGMAGVYVARRSATGSFSVRTGQMKRIAIHIAERTSSSVSTPRCVFTWSGSAMGKRIVRMGQMRRIAVIRVRIMGLSVIVDCVSMRIGGVMDRRIVRMGPMKCIARWLGVCQEGSGVRIIRASQ